MASKGNIRKRKRVKAIGRRIRAYMYSESNHPQNEMQYYNSKRGRKDSALLSNE
jgi:hypothetical protein